MCLHYAYKAGQANCYSCLLDLILRGHYQHLTALLCLGQQVLLSAADALKSEKTILKHNNAVLFQRSCTKLRAISSDVVEVHVIPGER